MFKPDVYGIFHERTHLGACSTHEGGSNTNKSAVAVVVAIDAASSVRLVERRAVSDKVLARVWDRDRDCRRSEREGASTGRYTLSARMLLLGSLVSDAVVFFLVFFCFTNIFLWKAKQFDSDANL